MKRLPVKWRKIRQELESKDYIFDTEADISPRIFLMVSGGVDSMFLLDFMSRCNVRFDVLHFSHNIRSPEETQKDLDVVTRGVEKANLNREHKITLRHGVGSDLGGANSEHKCHLARKEFISNEQHRLHEEFHNSEYAKSKREEYGLKYEYAYYNLVPRGLVVTAHNMNDNMEQVFMALMRGESHKRLAMKVNQHNVCEPNVFRPLLNVPKSTIIASAKYRMVEWNEDKTNEDIHHERNWLRNVIIPQLMERRNIETAMREELYEASKAGY